MKKLPLIVLGIIAFISCKKEKTTPVSAEQTMHITTSSKNLTEGALNDPNNIELLIKTVNTNDPTKCPEPQNVPGVILTKNFRLNFEYGYPTASPTYPNQFSCSETNTICYFTSIEARLTTSTGAVLDHVYMPPTDVLTVTETGYDYYTNTKAVQTGLRDFRLEPRK